jgi:Ca-activated chloride channel family protein
VYPQRIPDLFGAKPVILTGRFTSAGRGTIRLKGKMAGSDFVREVPVEFPETMALHDVLASLWARQRIDNLMGQDFARLQQGNMRPDLKETIMQLGLEFRLMTQFTSFVAVEEMVVTDGGQPRRIDVPVEVPEGVNRAAVSGDMDVVRVTHSGTNSSAFGLSQLSELRVVGRDQKTKRQAGQGSGDGRGLSVGGAGRGSVSPSTGAAPPPNAPPTVTVTADSGAILDASESAPMASPEDQRRQRLRTKLHPAVLAVIERLKNKVILAGADEAKFVRNGKADVQVWLTDKSDENLANLKELGFEVVLDPKSSKLIIGRLSIEKLEALADLKFVRYVAPQALKG